MKFLFVGNRRFVLEEMIALGLDVDILVIKNTHLANEKMMAEVPHRLIESKDELLKIIAETDFDVFLSNGCPFILPVIDIKPAIYVNIHPSYLPDLRGIDPCLGSIMFRKDAGASCHVINEKIDDGDIISQIKIPYSDDLDVSLLYQLSFLAEKQSFHAAFERNFEPMAKQQLSSTDIYYSRKPEDRILNFQNSAQDIVQTAKAFCNKSQGVFFSYQGKRYKCYEVSVVGNSYAVQVAKKCKTLEIVFKYEDCLIIKKDSLLLKLSRLESIEDFSVGTSIDCS
jgi:methionyl-tRNA formyltransferase